MMTLERENAAMARAQALIRTRSTDQLLAVWEMTTNNHDENIPMVRGWLMDEIERRYPAAFEAWICGDTEDSDLRLYVKGELR